MLFDECFGHASQTAVPVEPVEPLFHIEDPSAAAQSLHDLGRTQTVAKQSVDARDVADDRLVDVTDRNGRDGTSPGGLMRMIVHLRGAFGFPGVPFGPSGLSFGFPSSLFLSAGLLVDVAGLGSYVQFAQ